MNQAIKRGLGAGLAVLLLTPAASVPGELKPCRWASPDDRAECGSITVLEDRDQPDGRTIDLNVVVLRAATPNGSAPVFLLAGGPGQGATDLSGLAFGPYAAVRRSRDFVLVDQRGTGESNRLDCLDRSDVDPRDAFGRLFDAELIAQCRDAAVQHADLGMYGTSHVVADLDEVRAKLGYERVMLWGGSGGTRTALVWLREHPGRVEALVLDGVAPTYFRAPSGYARGSQDALERVFDDCAAQAACNDAYPDVRGDFERLLQMFDGGPVETFVNKDGERVAVEMHRGDFGYAVRGVLYRADAIAGLPKMIHEAASANDVSAFAQFYWQRNVGIRPFLATGVHLSVVGTEDLPFIDEASIPALTEGTFLGTYLIEQYAAACAAWGGRGSLPADFHEPVRSDVPVLLLSGYYDPSTTPHIAEEVASHLPNSRHVVVRNSSHGAGLGCAQQLVVDFLTTGSLEGLGAPCADAGSIVFKTN